jgi:hypothetical protein
MSLLTNRKKTKDIDSSYDDYSDIGVDETPADYSRKGGVGGYIPVESTQTVPPPTSEKSQA